MAHRDTSVSALCRDLGINPVTLYRYVGPQGQLREQARHLNRSLAGLIVTSNRGLRKDMREDIKDSRGEVGELRERMAHLEGIARGHHRTDGGQLRDIKTMEHERWWCPSPRATCRTGSAKCG